MPREVNLQRILSVVTERLNVKSSDVRGQRRHKSLVAARHACMFLARQMTPLSLEEIGGFFGNRDHSTVLHALKTVSQRVTQDEGYRDMLKEVERILRTGA